MQTNNPLISICIPTYNQGHLIEQALISCFVQDYPNFEVIIYDDASTDNTENLFKKKSHHIKYYRSKQKKGCGTGEAFNRAMSFARGKYIVLLCADDAFTDRRVLSDIYKMFHLNPKLGHISRYYFQFIDGDYAPVRAWHTNDIMELSNNPSGLAFNRKALKNKKCSNKMFIETAKLVKDILDEGWEYAIMKYDTVAVRVHNSISQSPEYYKKRWVSSPIESWVEVGGTSMLKDYTSLIQIKNRYVLSAVFKEIWNFIRLRPMNLCNPAFWFFSIVAIVTPKTLLNIIPHLYRKYIGSRITKRIKRP